MAAPTLTRGLTPADLDQIRGALTGGRRPKVTFTESAGQIAGQTGQVVALADPTHSDEWITVRFGKDELPFSPADLAVPGRATKGQAGDSGPSRGRTGSSASTERATTSRASEVGVTRARAVDGRGGKGEQAADGRGTRTVAAKAVPRAEATATPAGSASRTPAKAVRPPTPEPAFVLDQPPRPTPAPAPAPDGVAQPAEAEAKPKAERKAPKVKPPASLVVTLSYIDREWTLAATQGTKALAKPYVISPTEALRMVALIDVPTVHEAVESIITAERAEAQGKAERLRAELAEIEARLAELAQHP